MRCTLGRALDGKRLANYCATACSATAKSSIAFWFFRICARRDPRRVLGAEAGRSASETPKGEAGVPCPNSPRMQPLDRGQPAKRPSGQVAKWPSGQACDGGRGGLTGPARRPRRPTCRSSSRRPSGHLAKYLEALPELRRAALDATGWCDEAGEQWVL